MDERLKHDVQRLAYQRPTIPALKGASAPAPILPQTAIGAIDRTGSNGSGIASPLTEVSRTLHATQAVSSDGLFVWSLPDTITMIDANGVTVEFIYAAP
jgi:hypothetical protein